MSTLTGENHSTAIHSEQDLTHYFESFAKTREAMQVGLEAEFFGVSRATGKALPYHGAGGIQEVLKVLAERFDYLPIVEDENIIGLKRGASMIALEPGGQVELSAPPVANVFEIEDQIRSFLEELREISGIFPDIAWLAFGIHPFSGLEDIPWVPKRRYAIMAEYFKTHGVLSHHMMKRTASIQINLDYISEESAMAELRVALGLTSIVSALFANSSFSNGRLSGFVSERAHIWNHTDPLRSGLLMEFTRPDKTFLDYLKYLLDMPVIFVVRGGRWIPIQTITFRQFIREGFQGLGATLGDFELHLSTAFPEVRLKQYLEIRGADCQSPDLIPAVAALWKGIFYHAEARREAWKLVSFATEDERLELHRRFPKEGLKARLGPKPILPIAKKLIDISCASLATQICRDETRNECLFLDRIREHITVPGKSPAETVIENWREGFHEDPRRLIEYLRVG